MRFLHLSDLHVGKRVNEFPMLEDQRHILRQVVDLAVERAADAVLIAGDLYDKSAPSAEAVALVDWFLDALVGAGLKVLAVAGNHDSAERVAYASGLLARQGVHLSPVYDGRIASVSLPDAFGEVTFWLVPFLKPASVRPFFSDVQVETYTDALRTALGSCAIDPAQRNVVLSHQFVTCGAEPTERTDSELSLGGIDNVDASVYDLFDYAALGHVHRPQRVGRDEVRYAGSPLKYSFSEIPGTKSVPVVDLGPKGSVSIELVELVPLHDMRRIHGPLEALVDPSVVGGADPADYLRVILTDEQPVLDALARLRAVYPNVMAVEYDNARTRATGGRGEEAALCDVDERSPFELFSAFYERQNGAALSEGQCRVVREALEEAQVV